MFEVFWYRVLTIKVGTSLLPDHLLDGLCARSRWRGDFADYKQALFPANHCEEINVTTGFENGQEEEEEVSFIQMWTRFTLSVSL
jgi:hypothetical protein